MSGAGQGQTVLVVDDHPRIVELLRDYLEADGFTVRDAPDGPAALALLAEERVDCVVLDIMMPGQSGFDVCRRIRRFSNLPILFLSARGDDVDKIRGLGMGDDYIVKTASPVEIVARVKAVLRRAGRETGISPDAADILDFGRLVIDLSAQQARVAGTPVSLTAREFAMLRLLADHPRQVLTRERLFERLWDGYGEEGTLWSYIHRLREKIEEDPARPCYIVTVWGVGYRFEGTRR